MITSISKNKFINLESRMRPHSSVSDNVSESAVPQVHLCSTKLSKECVNTTIITTAKQQNACGRLSFKGNPVKLATDTAELLQKHPVMTKLAKSKWLSKFFLMADKNACVSEAFAALFLTCMLRPTTIMAMPHKKSDNEKNKKAAAHSISSGLIGYAFALAVFHPIGKIFSRIPKNVFPNPKNADTYRQALNYVVQIATVPIKAAITIGLIPIIDKHIIGRVFGNKEFAQNKKSDVDLKNPFYSYSYLMNFKGVNKSNLFFKAKGVNNNANS